MNSPRELRYDRFVPEQEGRREVLCAVGNGVFVSRGSAAWAAADGIHYPATYLAGGYDRACSTVGGREIENEDLVNLVNWWPIALRWRSGEGAPNDPAAGWFEPTDAELADHLQVLHLDRGVLEHRARFRTPDGAVLQIHEERLVHMADAHLAAQRTLITFEHDDSQLFELRVGAGIDGGVDNHGVERYEELESHHAEVFDTAGRPLDDTDPRSGGRIWLRRRTNSSHLEVATGATVEIAGLTDIAVDAEGQRVDVRAAGLLAPGDQVRVDKIIATRTSRDRPGYEPVTDMHRTLDRAGSYDDVVAAHGRAWAELWETDDLRLETGDEWADTVLALHRFHLHQSYSELSVDRDAGIPARGWHGEAYRGHIFWDELFVLPLFNYKFPQRTRAAIRYRHRRLGEAQQAARAAGHRGAMFPWQSGSTGREESQQWHLNPKSGRWNPDPTHRQRHIGLAIAYNAWQHRCVTADDEFLYEVGAELILSVADYFADLASWDDEKRRFVICGVIGPDEYHTGYVDRTEHGLDNNAYTNVMTSWLLDHALGLIDELPLPQRGRILKRLDLDQDRLDHWRAVSRQLYVPFIEVDPTNGDHETIPIIEQFEGYADLDEFDWDGYRERYGDISRLDRILEAEDDTTNRYKASKQADVVMLFYLLTAQELSEIFDRLGYEFGPDAIPANIDYYRARTSHGSTLSMVVHAWVQARRDRARSWEQYQKALASDVDDVQGGTTPEGIHLGAMAGTVDLAQRCYSGLAIDGDIVRLNPRLPDEVRSLSFSIQFRTHWRVNIEVTHSETTVSCASVHPDPIRVAVKDEVVELLPGASHRFDLVELKGP